MTVTVDVELSGSVALTEAEAERDLLRSTTKTDHDRIMALEATLAEVRRLVNRPPVDCAMAARGSADLDGYTVIMGGTLAAVRSALVARA